MTATPPKASPHASALARASRVPLIAPALTVVITAGVLALLIAGSFTTTIGERWSFILVVAGVVGHVIFRLIDRIADPESAQAWS